MTNRKTAVIYRQTFNTKWLPDTGYDREARQREIEAAFAALNGVFAAAFDGRDVFEGRSK